MHRREQAERRTADQHIMKVGDHEIAVVLLGVRRSGRVHDAGKAAHHEEPEEPSANIIGVRSRSWPPQRVPIQLKIFTPVGTAMAMVARANAEVATVPCRW